MNVRKVVFDIETKQSPRFGKNDVKDLELSIVCIYDSQTDTYSSYLEEELPKLWPILETTDILIGYNSNHFDIPILNNYYPGDLRSIKSIDLLKEIKRSLGKRIRLEMVAQGTLGKGKSGHGLDAITWWRDGEIDKLREYCLDDVKLTKEVYDFARVNNKVCYKDLGRVRDIKLNAEKWEDVETSSMTHTLPF